MAATPERVLIATDFSTTADSAEKLGFQLARRLGAELHVLHVRVILEDPLMAEEKQLEIERLMASTDDDTRAAFDRNVDSKSGVAVQTHLVRSISAAEAIAETSSELGCDLIVMGTHGRRGLKHFLLGSVAENVVRSVRIPVLTVRPGAELSEQGLRKILVPFDFSEPSTRAATVARDWAEALGAEITLLHVVEPVVYPELYSINVVSDDVMTRLRDRATEALDDAAEEIFGDWPVSSTVLIGRAADTIVAEAQPENYDLVVMGTRGLSGLEHIVLGSVVEAVLRRCPVPLLTVSGEG